MTEPATPPTGDGFAMDGPVEKLFLALAKAQAGFAEIKKTKTVKVQTNKGGAYQFNYAPLEVILDACVPSLNKNGLAFTQPLGRNGMDQLLHTMLTHESGAWIRSTIRVPAIDSTGEGVKALGSLLTYLRRYSAQALLGVTAEEDDDAGAASGDHTQQLPNRHAGKESDEDFARRLRPRLEPTPTSGPDAHPKASTDATPVQPPAPAAATAGTPTPPASQILTCGGRCGGKTISERVRAYSQDVYGISLCRDCQQGATPIARGGRR